MKKFNKIILTFALCACAFFGFTACKEEEVILLKAELPSVTLYEGQELDLVGGVLHYQIDDEKSTVSLASSDVSVSGYDKTKQGEQTITVSYKGESLTVAVTVLSRLTIEGAQTTYYVKESFNDAKGTVKVLLDDGSTISVPMNDEKITVEGFDSETENNALALQVTYTDGAFSYGKELKVKVVEIEASLKKPSRLAYNSHDTALDLSGGYLSITVNGKTDFVGLTQDMVSGFAPESLGIEDYGTSVMQPITVTYKNRTFSFSVQVTYSNISMIRHYAAELAALDWSGEEAPEISAAQGANALMAVNAYIGLDDEEKALITEEEKANVLRPAVVYGYKTWETEAKAYENTFVVSGNTVVLTCDNYETTKIDFDKLQDTNALIYTLGDQLATIAREFKDDSILDTKVGEYLAAVYSKAALENCRNVLGYMITLYEALDDITATEWSAEDLVTYKEGFDAALEAISNTVFKGYDNRFIYKMVSGWREADDYMELMYTYFYNLEEAESTAALEKLKDVALPGILEELYVTVVDAIWQTTYMANGKIIDTTEFMVLFENAFELMQEIEAYEDGDMYKDLYETLKFSGILQSDGKGIEVTYQDLYDFVRTTDNGFIYHLHTIWETDLYSMLWEPYIAIITNETDGYFESDQYKSDVAALFKTFVELTPAQQYSFLDSLNVYYRYTQQQPVLALSIQDNMAYSTFSMIIANHFKAELGDELYPLYEKLVTAMEYYVLRYKYDIGQNFVNNMYKAEMDYLALEETPELKEKFDNALGYFYEKYYNIYLKESTGVSTDLGTTWGPKFEELATALRDAYDACALILGGSVKIDAYAWFFSAYKKAVIISNEIKAADTDDAEDILYAYYYEDYKLNDDVYSMDSWMLLFKEIYADFMLDIRLTTTSGDSIILWDIYLTETYNMDEFFVSIYDLLHGYRNQADGGFDNLASADVLAVMEAYRNLSAQKQIVLGWLDGSANFYRNAISLYFEEKLTTSLAEAVAAQLWIVEDAYIDYFVHVTTTEEEKIDPEKQKAFEDAMKILQQKYTLLTEEDPTEFDDLLKSVYDHYVGLYDQLTAPENNEQGGDTGSEGEETEGNEQTGSN